MNNNMTVFIIDDDPAVLDSLTLMSEQAGLTAQAFNSAEAFLDSYHPEMQGCAILDVNMQNMNGIQLQQALIARNIRLPVIFLTGHGDIPMSVKTVKAGASDFLTKPVTREKLLNSIQTAFLECENLLTQQKINQQSLSLLATLTDREQEVMHLALDGQSNKKIAQNLGISHRTVEIHKARVMQKTGVDNLLALAHIVQEAGLIEEPIHQHTPKAPKEPKEGPSKSRTSKTSTADTPINSALRFYEFKCRADRITADEQED